jgi:nucleotide-binding universal stress UspA family protein
MGVIMIIVLVSRAIVIPVYLSDLKLIDQIAPENIKHLQNFSFGIMALALVAGAGIILRALIVGMHVHHLELAVAAATAALAVWRKPLRLSPIGRFDHVLVATDGSEFSAGAIRVGTRFAKRNKSELTTMSMVMIELETEGIAAEVIKRAEAEGRKVLAAAQVAIRAEGYDTRIELRAGVNPHKEIVRLADDQRADLIVMGRRGRRGLALLMVGDSTRKVIGFADCSVLVVPRAAEIWQQRILLATDGSRHGERAAESAGQVAKIFGLPITVVSVLRPRFDEVRRAEAQLEVDRVREAVAHEGIEVDSVILEGAEPGAVIVDFARQRSADLIVMGSHGRTGIGRLLMGSVAEQVIGQATCSVLVVKT